MESPSTTVSPTLPREYHDLGEVFSKERTVKLPQHKSWDCTIELLPNAMPPRSKVYPLSIPEKQAMEDYVQEALVAGYSQPSTSPAAVGFFFVEKKDGGLCPCIDYRGLNAITVPYPYPLPLMPVALEQLRRARIYTKLDLRSAYNLVRIREGAEWKTAFHTTHGHYEYQLMPYGLTNALAVFQSLINEVFRDMLNRYVIAYIDDILICSPDLELHIKHVRAVLRRLSEHRLYAKLKKCEFHQSSMTFLGYVISQIGVEMDMSKMSAITAWPETVTVKDLQRFLGFANFYRRFIRNYSTMASPLMSLLKGKPHHLRWTESAKRAFQLLKQCFTCSPFSATLDRTCPSS